MGMKLSATVAALASTLVLASGAAAITNGQPDGSAHSNVGAVYVTAPNFGGTFIVCSGTLVAPGVLLTAAHCLLAPPDPTVRFSVSFAPSIDQNNIDPASLIPAKPVMDPQFQNCDCPDPHDIGVLLFDPAAAARIKPVKLPKLGVLDKLVAKRQKKDAHDAIHSRVGKPGHRYGNGNSDKKLKFGHGDFVDVGYGITDINAWDPGTRRATASGDSVLDDNFLTLSQDVSRGFGGTCIIDSGGPQFVGDVQVSMTEGGDETCSQVGVNLRLDTPTVQAFLAPFGVRF